MLPYYLTHPHHTWHFVTGKIKKSSIPGAAGATVISFANQFQAFDISNLSQAALSIGNKLDNIIGKYCGCPRSQALELSVL